MHRKIAGLLIFAVILVPGVFCQVTSTVGPATAPLGCPISISIANDNTTSAIWTGVCPYNVADLSGNIVFQPFCVLIVVSIAPGGVFTVQWDQKDGAGNQMPPGVYIVNVFLPGSAISQSHVITLAGVDAGMTTLGPLRPGTTRGLSLCSPQNGNNIYGIAASMTTNTGIPTCGGTFPLDNDALFQLSLASPSPNFHNFLGTLNAQGTTDGLGAAIPSITVPNIPGLTGLSFNLAFLTIDPAQACAVTSISLAVPVTIQ